jgi:hypothetical protein
MKQVFRWVGLASCVVLLAFVLLAGSAFAGPSSPNATPPAIDWTGSPDNMHLTYDQMSQMLQDLNTQYPNITKLFSIGHSWQERQLWCLQLSAPIAAAGNKTAVAMFGNIHGGEQQSGQSAAYTAWYLATQYGKDPAVTKLLSKYNVYIVPLINPDGYDWSFYVSTRQNMRPTDKNGVGGPFSDPRADTNGDGFIAQIYQQNTGSPPEVGTIVTGNNPDPTNILAFHPATQPTGTIYESMGDPDGNGLWADDSWGSTVDMNRNFDYLWNYHNVGVIPNLGANAWNSAGPDAASEPEVQAVQNFLKTHPVRALSTLHTGEQSVLWPWCYSPEPTTDDAFMQSVSEAMADVYTADTGRGMYTLRSYDDYPTAAELIDFGWGRLNIHSYTQEVYAGGGSAPSPTSYRWGAAFPTPPDQWIYMGDWQGQTNIWFQNRGSDQMLGHTVPDEELLDQAIKDGFLVMANSEPSGLGPIVPDWILW